MVHQESTSKWGVQHMLCTVRTDPVSSLFGFV